MIDGIETFEDKFHGFLITFRLPVYLFSEEYARGDF